MANHSSNAKPQRVPKAVELLTFPATEMVDGPGMLSTSACKGRSKKYPQAPHEITFHPWDSAFRLDFKKGTPAEVIFWIPLARVQRYQLA